MAEGSTQPESVMPDAAKAWVVRIYEIMLTKATSRKKPEANAREMNEALNWARGKTEDVKQTAARFTPDLPERITGERDLVD